MEMAQQLRGYAGEEQGPSHDTRADEVAAIAHRLTNRNIPPVDIDYLKSLGVNVEYQQG